MAMIRPIIFVDHSDFKTFFELVKFILLSQFLILQIQLVESFPIFGDYRLQAGDLKVISFDDISPGWLNVKNFLLEILSYLVLLRRKF